MQNTILVGRAGIAATGDSREGARNDAVGRSQTIEHRAVPRDGKVAFRNGEVGRRRVSPNEDDVKLITWAWGQ